MRVDQAGWDVTVYHNALRSLAVHHDPYVDAMAVQDACHATHCVERTGEVPFSYVYSPITLWGLRAIGALPGWLSGLLYWSCYAAAVLAQLWVCMTAALEKERGWLLLLTPVAVFFPGLLASGIILSGNVAFLVYAAVLLTAFRGWQSGSWRWFYLVVLGASCLKVPWLALVLIPLLTARRQWPGAMITLGAGSLLFAAQPLLWPDLFRHYVRAVSLMFLYNRDFGCGPAGLFSDVLSQHGTSYSAASLVFYLSCAVPLLAVLFYLSRRYHEGHFPFQEWFPVMLVGVLLLNPRLIEYDVAPLTLPMVMIVWRFLGVHLTAKRAAITFAIGLVLLNCLAIESWEVHKFVDGPLLVLCFGMGLWTLFRQIPQPASDSLPGLVEAFAMPESVDLSGWRE